MEIVTIACPLGFTDPNVADNAPIWLDSNGIEYRVASGLLDGYALEEDIDAITGEASKPAKAQPDRVNTVVGMDGIDALGAMGLTLKKVKV